MSEFRRPADSRYKDTGVVSIDGNVTFGLFTLPEEFVDTTGTITEKVNIVDTPYLDAMMTRLYGPGFESAAWMIAAQNGIIDPDRELEPGMTLNIPTYASIRSFQGRKGIPSNG